MELHDVVWINAPSYDELGVKHIWPLMKSDPDFMKYFPDKMAKGRLPDRTYFWNVLNTYDNDYAEKLIKHAHEQRNSGTGQLQEDKTIVVSQTWEERLMKLPFISCKYSYGSHIIRKTWQDLESFEGIVEAIERNPKASENSHCSDTSGVQEQV